MTVGFGLLALESGNIETIGGWFEFSLDRVKILPRHLYTEPPKFLSPYHVHTTLFYTSAQLVQQAVESLCIWIIFQSISKPTHHQIMATVTQKQTSRTREKPAGDEEATADLKLGEFQGVPTLTLSEARLLINAVIDHRKKAERTFDETE